MKMSPAAKLGSALIVATTALAVFGSAFVYLQVLKAKSDGEGARPPAAASADYPGRAGDDR